MLFALVVELQAHREVFLEDLALVSVPLNLLISVEKHHVIRRDARCEPDLLLDAAILSQDFAQVWHCEHKTHRVVFVVLADLLDLIFLGQLLQVLLEVPSPPFDGKFGDLKLGGPLASVDALENVCVSLL